MRTNFRVLSSLLAVGLLAGSLAAQVNSASRNDNDIQVKVAHELAKKQQFRNLHSSVQDGIVTLTGTLDIYHQKLDAAKKIRKTDHAQGVRNLVDVAGKAVPAEPPDTQIDTKVNVALM